MHEGISLFTYIRCFSYLVILSGDFFCTFYSPSSRWWNRVGIDESFHVMTAVSIKLGAINMKRSFHHSADDELFNFISCFFTTPVLKPTPNQRVEPL